MNNSLLVSLFIFVLTAKVTGQSLQVSAGAGVDNGRTYRAKEQPGWPLQRGRHILPLITLGFSKMTDAGNIRSLNVLFTSESNRLESTNPLLGDAGRTVYYRNGVQYEIMFPLSKTGKRHQLFTGYAVSASHSMFRFLPSSSVYFPQTRRGVMLEAGGCFEYRVTLKNGLCLYSGINLNIIGTGIEVSSVENPLLTKEQQTNTIFEMGFGPRVILHAGACVTLASKKQ